MPARDPAHRMPQHARRSSARSPVAWLAVGAGLALYMGLVFALARAHVRLDVPLPWWAAQAVAPLLYGVLTLLCVRRVSAGRWIAGTLLLWALHLLAGMGTVALSMIFDPAAHGQALLGAFPPPPVPQLLWVPLWLIPLRDVLAPSPVPRGARPSGVGEWRRPQPAHAWVPIPAAAAGPPAAKPALPVSEPPIAPEIIQAAAAPLAIVEEPPLGFAHGEPSHETPAPLPATVEPVRSMEAEPEPTVAPRPGEPAQDAIRIGFDRIAGQLPAGTFLVPLEQVGARLREPGRVMVPRRVVLPQLGEGRVRVAWQDIADQFPSDLLAAADDEIARAIPDGGLALPLDEVVRQLPPDMFAAAGAAPDVRGIEQYPAPFQPVPAEEPAAALTAGAEETGEEIAAAAAGESPALVGDALPPLEEPAPPAVEIEEPLPTAAPEESLVAEEPAPVEPAAGEEIVRIGFDRIAGQLPADAFLLPLERVAANLLEPGRLLVPQRLVLPQLGEGLVRVAWEDVAEQFPRHLLAVTDEELARAIPGGALVLPLDEVIRQLPPDVFAAAGAAPDVRGIENYPAPFQPFVPASGAAVTESDALPVGDEAAAWELEAVEAVADAGAAAPVDASAPVEIEAPPEPDLVLESEAALEPPRFEFPAAEPEPALEEIEPPVESAEEIVAALPPVEEEEPEPVLEIPFIEPEPALMEAIEAELQAAALVPDEVEEPAWPPPLQAPGEAATTAPAAPAPRPEALSAARRIAALMGPLASLDVDAQVVDGVTLFLLSSPGVPQDMAATAAGLMLPLLAAGRAPWAVDQVTLRGPGAAVVLTPLGPPGSAGPVLVAAIPQGGSLALLEILCRRAAVAYGAGPGSPGGERLRWSPERGLPDLLDAEPPAQARQAAQALGALGPVTASALRDPAGESALYLFLPSGCEARAFGAFAHEVHRALRKAAGSGAVFRAAILRSGPRRLVIRPEEVVPGRCTVVVAAGETARPGLAYHQVERAAAALRPL